MSEQRNFLGIPIEGDVSQGTPRANQRSQEEFAEIFKAVLDDEAIVDFGWAQYTPYFNDGEPCVFGASDLWVRSIWDGDNSEWAEAPDDVWGWNASDSHPTLGNRRWTDHSYVAWENPNFDEARLERCVALSRALTGEEFDDVLLVLFGDHANVWVRKEGITVDEYSHD